MNKLANALKQTIITFIVVMWAAAALALGTYIISDKTDDGQYLLERYCSDLDQPCANTCRPNLDTDCSDCCNEWGERKEPVYKFVKERTNSAMFASVLLSLLVFGFYLFSGSNPKPKEEDSGWQSFGDL